MPLTIADIEPDRKEDTAPAVFLGAGGCYVAAQVMVKTGRILWTSRMTNEYQAKNTVREWLKERSPINGMRYAVIRLGVIGESA